MWIPLDVIKLWQGNSNEGNIGAIYAAIERFGFRNPIGLNKGNVVYNGNHRVKALHELRKAGWQPFGSCIRVVDGTWEIECIDNTDLSESDSVAYGLADNRTARLGRDDAAKLLALLTPLPAQDILAAGYDSLDLQELQETLGVKTEYETCPHCGAKTKVVK